MKKLRMFLACMIVIVLCAGCASSGPKVAKPTIDHPPYCDAFLKVIGKGVQEVVSALGLTMDDFQDNIKAGNVIVCKKPVEFLGHTFEMQMTVVGEDVESAKAISIHYIIKEKNPETGAGTVVDLRDKLLKGYGSAYNGAKNYSGNYEMEETREPSPLNTYTKADLVELFTDDEGGGHTEIEWLLSVDLSHIPQEALGMPSTCITAKLNADYPVSDSQQEDGKYVLINLVYGLSRSYRDVNKG